MPKMIPKLLLSLSILVPGAAFGAAQTMLGESSATADTDTYESVQLEISGEAALALFNVTVAMARVETVNDHLRRVQGGNLVCFEHFAQTPLELPVYYTCEVRVAQGGYMKVP